MARGKHKKCGVKSKPASPRKCDIVESVPKKRGRPRSHQTQSVSSCPTPEIVHQEIAPKKRGRPTRSQLTQNVSCPTPETIAQESAQKKRGRPPRSSQNQNVSFPTSEIVDQENSTEKRRGRKRKNEKENDSCVNQDFTPKDTIPKKRVRKNGINNGKKKLTEVQYVDCDLISQEDILQENLETFCSPENDDAADDIVLDPLTSSQCVQKREIPLVKKYEIKEEDVEIVDDQTSTVNVNLIEKEEPTPDRHSQWPQACVLLAIETPIPTSSAVFCNSIGPPENAAVNDNLEKFDIVEDESLGPALSPSEIPASTSSADIYGSINGPFENSAADNQLEKSEVKEADEPVLLNSDEITEFEDSVVEAIAAGALHSLNSEKDKLGACKGLLEGIKLFVKIKEKDPTILTLSACFSTEKLYVILDTIKEMTEPYEQDSCYESLIKGLSWFFNTAGAEVIKEAIHKSQSEEEKSTKIRDINIFLEVIKNNWKNIPLMKKNSQASKPATTSVNGDPECITRSNITTSLNKFTSGCTLNNTNTVNCIMKNNTSTVLSAEESQSEVSAREIQKEGDKAHQAILSNYNMELKKKNTTKDFCNISNNLFGNALQHKLSTIIDSTAPIVGKTLSEESVNLTTQSGKNQPENEIVVHDQNNSTPINISSVKKHRRKNYCMFCKKLVTNFTRHTLQMHGKNETVKKYKALLKQKGSKLERLEIFNELRLKGNNIYNNEIIKDSKMRNTCVKNLLMVRGYSKGRSCKVCTSCNGFFQKKSFYNHKCFKRYRNQEKSENNEEVSDLVRNYKTKYFGIDLDTNEEDSVINDNITQMLKSDPVTQMAFNDPLIMSVVFSHQRKLKKKNSKAFEQYFFKKIKLGCSFLLKLKKKDCSIHTLVDCFIPPTKETISETIHEMCKFNERSGKIGISSMPGRLMRFMQDATAQALKDVVFEQPPTDEKDVVLEQPPTDEKKIALMRGCNEILSVLQKMMLLTKSQTETVKESPHQITQITNNNNSNNKNVNTGIASLTDNILPEFIESVDNSIQRGGSSDHVTENTSSGNAKSEISVSINPNAINNIFEKNSMFLSGESTIKPLIKPVDSLKETVNSALPLRTIKDFENSTQVNEDNSPYLTELSGTLFEKEVASEKKNSLLGSPDAVLISTERNLSIIDGSNLMKNRPYSNEECAGTTNYNLKNTYNLTHNGNKQKNYCMYCKKLVTNFGRHVKRVHRNEKDVLEANNMFRRNTKDARGESVKMLNEIRLRGNHVYNQKLLANSNVQGSIQSSLLLKKIRLNFQGTLQDLVTCSFCKGVYGKKTFYKHIKLCYSRKKYNSKIHDSDLRPIINSARLFENELLGEDCFEQNSVAEFKKINEELINEETIKDLSTRSSPANYVCLQDGFIQGKTKHGLLKTKQRMKHLTATSKKHNTTRPYWIQRRVTRETLKRVKYYCMFCNKFVLKFIRHVLVRHKDKEPVIQYMTLLRETKDSSKTERRKIMRSLQLKSKNAYVKKCARNLSSMNITTKFSQKCSKLNKSSEEKINDSALEIREEVEEFGNKSLTCTKQNNQNVPITSDRNDITMGGNVSRGNNNICFYKKYSSPLCPIPSPIPQASLKFRELVYPRLRNDDISKLALEDPLLVASASSVLKRMLGNKSRVCGFNCTNKIIRDGGKLLKCVQSLDKTITGFRDLMKPSKVNSVFEAAKEICGLDEKTGSIKFTSTPFRITYVINQVAAQVVEEASTDISLNENDKKLILKDIDEFLEKKREKFRSIITRWPASKKQRKSWNSRESDEESNDDNFPDVSTSTEGSSSIKKKSNKCGSGRLATKRRNIYTSSESEDTSFDESDGDCNPTLKYKNEGTLSRRITPTADSCNTDFSPKEESPYYEKKRWTEKQKRIVILEFKEFIINGTNPGRKRCRELIASSEELAGRTPDQVNLMIDNINKWKLKLPPEFEHLRS